MDKTVLNGLAPYQQNGHDHPALGHEVINNLHQNNLLMEDVLKAKEQDVPTAKMESPDAVTDQAQVAQEKTVEKPKRKTVRQAETGNAVNVQNLRLVTQRIIGFGSSYLQGSPLYTVENLDAVYDTAMASLQNVTDAKRANDHAVDQQGIAFGNLKDLATRTKNSFIWCGVSAKAIERMESLNHEIQGSRVIPIYDGDDEKHISASHQSRTQQIQHVDALIKFLSSYPEYLPPANITVTAWKNKRDEMDRAFLDENAKSSNLKAARIQRNDDIYKTITGAVEIGLGAKRTVLAIYGFKSPQYAAVKGIQFKRMIGWKDL